MSARERKKMTNILLVAGAVAAVAALVIGGGYLARIGRYQAAVRALDPRTPDLAAIADGTHVGSCDVDVIGAEVAVTVEGGRIVDVEILSHENERGQAAERIVEDIVRAGRVDVDTVTGATNSSKMIEQAAANALAAAPKR